MTEEGPRNNTRDLSKAEMFRRVHSVPGINLRPHFAFASVLSFFPIEITRKPTVNFKKKHAASMPERVLVSG